MGRRGLPVSLAVFAACTALGLLGPSEGRASWDQVQVKVVTIHYKTHDGYRRAAYVVLPDWYGPGDNPPLPLIISPHGRGEMISGSGGLSPGPYQSGRTT